MFVQPIQAAHSGPAHQAAPPPSAVNSLLTTELQPVTLLEIAQDACVLGPNGRQPTFFCVLSGTLVIFAQDQPPLRVSAGSAVLVPQGLRVNIAARLNARSAEPLTCEQRSARGDLPRIGTAPGERPMRALFAQLRAPDDPLLAAGDDARLLAVDLHDIGNLRLAFAAMCSEVEHPRAGVRMLGSALLRTCFVHLCRKYFPDSSERGVGRAARAVEAVLTAPAAAHSLESLASCCNLSRSTFIRHFTREMGLPPMEFVQRIRLERAARLLKTTNEPVKVVAAQCGFVNRSHFSRAFRSAHGMDPTRFRDETAIVTE